MTKEHTFEGLVSSAVQKTHSSSGPESGKALATLAQATALNEIAGVLKRIQDDHEKTNGLGGLMDELRDEVARLEDIILTAKRVHNEFFPEYVAGLSDEMWRYDKDIREVLNR